MVDSQTINQYRQNAEKYICRYDKSIPDRLYDIIKTFFLKNASTIDVGCGSGRDIDFLTKQGYKVEGLDATDSFVTHCKSHFPDKIIHHDSLPYLKTIDSCQYHNVLLSGVLMHVPNCDLVEAVINLLRVTKIDGRIIVSIRKARASECTDNMERERDGRLFSSIPPGKLVQLFESLGAKLIYQEKQKSDSRKSVTWHNFVFEKIQISNRSGIEKIQEIIVKDKKDTSYKLALLRSLCHIAKTEHAIGVFDHVDDIVWIPLKRVGFYFLRFYFPLLKTEDTIRQSKTHSRIALRKPIERLKYGKNELFRLVVDYDSGRREEIDRSLKEIVKTVVNQPMRYSGDSTFKYMSPRGVKSILNSEENQLGMIGVPVDVWRDMTFFNHWIEDSLVLQWARFMEKINTGGNIKNYLDLLSSQLADQRTTDEIADIFQGTEVECIWSGVNTKDFQIDHMIPYSLWGNNDIWNLAPAATRVNSKKQARIPTPELVKRRKDCLIYYWSLYINTFPDRFFYQTFKSLGVDKSNWEKQIFLAFYETISRLYYHKIAEGFEPN